MSCRTTRTRPVTLLCCDGLVARTIQRAEPLAAQSSIIDTVQTTDRSTEKMAASQSVTIDPTCKACTGAWPNADHFIADLGLSKVYLHDDQFFPGWTVVVLQRHATELFHLAAAERSQLMEDVNTVARALTRTYDAKKINYELPGNQLPHIHWHIIPRLTNDPAPLEPVWRVTHEPLLHHPSQLRSAIQGVQEAIRHTLNRQSSETA